MTALVALKAHLNIDFDTDDTLLSSKIAAAEDHITTYIGDEEIATTFDTARPAIREAILQLAAYWYAQREGVSETSLKPIPFGVRDLLEPYRAWAF